jgi:indole-3-glycerol phosphate synthase
MGILETIVEERRADARKARLERPPSSLARLASPPRPAFGLSAGGPAGTPHGSRRPCLIAECKKASPSRGLLVADYDPKRLALAYERGGAGMISVLTEPRRFLGSDRHLELVRGAVGLPVLRKDFVVDPYQLREAWALGADAVLLISAALCETEMAELASCARELGLALLIEAHSEEEIERAEAARPDAIGVNARDLRDFSVDPGRAAALAALLPEGPARVAESGMRSTGDAAALRRAGFDCFLVGEALATSADPEATAREFAAAIEGKDGR